MKKNVSGFCLFLFVFATQQLLAQVGINTTTPRGVVEMASNNSGVLLPRVALTSADSANPVINLQDGGTPIEGTIVYNTATAGIGTNSITPGLYMWGGTSWQRFGTTSAPTVIEDDLRTTLDRGSGSTAVSQDYAPNSSTSKIWYFPVQGGNTSEMFFTVQLPHNWVTGTRIYPHVHWTPKANSSANVKMTWFLDYQWVDLNETTPDVIPLPSTLSGTTTRTFAKGEHVLTYIGGEGATEGIDGTGKHASSIIICRLYRVPSHADDTLDTDAGGLSVDFHLSLYQ